MTATTWTGDKNNNWDDNTPDPHDPLRSKNWTLADGLIPDGSISGVDPGIFVTIPLGIAVTNLPVLRTLGFVGGLHVASALTLSGTPGVGSTGELRFSNETNSATISGGGIIQMNHGLIDGITNQTVIDADVVIKGTGTILVDFVNNAGTLVNDVIVGSFVAAQGGTLNIGPFITFTNNGVLEAENDSNLTIAGYDPAGGFDGVTLDNTGGGVVHETGTGTVTIAGAKILGGTFIHGTTPLYGGGFFVWGNSTLDGTTAPVDLKAQLDLQGRGGPPFGAANLTLTGSIVNETAIVADHAGFGEHLLVNGTATLSGHGTVSVDSIAGANAAAVLVNADNKFVDGGSISGLTLFNEVGGSFVNDSATSALAFQSDVNMANSGLIEDTSIWGLDLSANTIQNKASGVIEANGHGSFVEFGQFSLVQLINDGTVEADGGKIYFGNSPGSLISGSGKWLITNGGTIDIAAEFHGHVVFQGPGLLKLESPLSSGLTIDGFGSGDTIDLTGIAGTAYESDSGGIGAVLRAFENADGTSATLQADMDGNRPTDSWVSIATLTGISAGDVLGIAVNTGLSTPVVVTSAPASPAYGDENDNTLVGGVGDDVLAGLGGNDTLTDFFGGNDLLDGGTGNDTMTGGPGNDIYVVDSNGDVVNEHPGEGTDTITTTLNAYTLPDNVENLTFTGSGAFSGFGNVLDNTITGGTDADVLDGGAGVDHLIGRLGNDLYYVQDTGDVIVENPNEGSDSVIAYVNYTLPANVEAIYTLAGSGATGNDGDNLLDGAFAGSGQTLDGQGGNDVIYGTFFNDTLIGGAGSDALYDIGGNDTMQGGAGDDAYFVNSAADVVQENAAEGSDTIYASVNFTLPANVEVLEPYGAATRGDGNDDANVLLGVASDHGLTLDGHGGNDVIYGSNFDDTLIGGAGDDLLWGFGGNDTMQGGTGNDTYIVEQVGDLVQENPGEGNDTIYASVNITLPSNVENLFIYGAATSGTGNAGDNFIVNEFITTGVTLTGGGGNDTFVFIPGTAAGSTITDFNGNGAGAGDVLEFAAYGAGATFTNIDPTHWQVNYGAGLSQHDVITFSNAAAIDPSDVLFV